MKSAGCCRLKSVILATQEEEIRRIEVQSQPRQIVHKTLSQKNPWQKKELMEWLKVKALSSSRTKKKRHEIISATYQFAHLIFLSGLPGFLTLLMVFAIGLDFTGIILINC
jgi:hypothetical protein